jgi:hypothetical protein
MNEPRRLSQSGGFSQRLLDSASIDKPSEAARRRAAAFAGTAGAFASSASGETSIKRPKHKPIKTFVTWIAIGAAASVALAVLGAQLLDSASPRPAAAPPNNPMAELPTAPPRARPNNPDISPENGLNSRPAPAPSVDVKPPPSSVGSIVPWVPSPVVKSVAAAPSAAPGVAAPSKSAFDEIREIEAARAAVSRGDDKAAIATLNDYDATHPQGDFKPEAMALRVQALNNSGNTGEAKKLATEFEGKYPKHPLVQQVKTVGK